jgi:hypothetical protein
MVCSYFFGEDHRGTVVEGLEKRLEKAKGYVHAGNSGW